ncbi:MAG: ComEC/Rec2 family competence protein [Patescibacteria group bacterium]|jgi:ComEC/Rec2-related protein
MTPSRWLFITSFIICAGISLVYPGVSLYLKVFWFSLVILVIVFWQIGAKGFFIGVMFLSLTIFRTQSFLDFEPLVATNYVAKGKVEKILDESFNRQNIIIESQNGNLLVSIVNQKIKIGDYAEIFCQQVSIPKISFTKIRQNQLSGECLKPEIKKIIPSKINFKNIFYQAGQNFSGSLQKILPLREASLAAGMTIGDTTNFSKAELDNFRKTGISHIIAVSGSNLSIILIFITFVFQKYFSKTLKILLISGLIFSFVVLTGGEASILRAAVMAILALIVQRLGRPVSGINLLFTAGIILLVINPSLLYDSKGFQLSFGATFGLIAFSQILENKFSFLPKVINSVLAATLGATFGTLAISLINFQQVSIIGPLVNIIVVPLVPWIMGLAIFVGLVGFVFVPLAQFIGLSAWALLRFVEITSDFAARLPGASLILPSWLAIVLSLFIIVLLSLIFKKHVKTFFA